MNILLYTNFKTLFQQFKRKFDASSFSNLLPVEDAMTENGQFLYVLFKYISYTFKILIENVSNIGLQPYIQ